MVCTSSHRGDFYSLKRHLVCDRYCTWSQPILCCANCWLLEEKKRGRKKKKRAQKAGDMTSKSNALCAAFRRSARLLSSPPSFGATDLSSLFGMVTRSCSQPINPGAHRGGGGHFQIGTTKAAFLHFVLSASREYGPTLRQEEEMGGFEVIRNKVGSVNDELERVLANHP